MNYATAPGLLILHPSTPTIERIEQTTWGVKLVEVNGRRFAILPESTPRKIRS